MTERRGRLVAVGLTGLAVVPVVVAVVRAIVDGWYPMGDNALYALRARDVLTSNHPLLGPWTSASLGAGTDMNHPGPLLVDLLALPVRVDAIRGVPVGIGLLQLAVVVGIALVARRLGGLPVMALVLAATTALAWSLGSEMLVDPWQPNAMLLPFLLFLVLVWAVARGDGPMLPLAVAVGTLVVQSHVSYIVVVPGLLAIAVLVCALRDRTLLRRPLLVAAAVGLVLWAQPLVEQVTADGTGNLARLATARSGAFERAGPMLAARLVAGVEVVPPAWLRPSYGETYFVPIPSADPTAAEAAASNLPSATVGVVGCAVLLAVLGAAAASARRRSDRGDPTGLMGVLTAAAALGLLAVSATVQPVNPILGLGGHQVASLWPLGAFLAAVLAVVAVAHRRAAVWAGAAVVAVGAMASIPAHGADVGPRLYDDGVPTMRALAPQLAELEGGPYLVDVSNLYFAEPYSTPTMFELERHGVEVRVDDEVLVRQLGEGRRFDGTADGRLYLQVGRTALAPPPRGHRRVALARHREAALTVGVFVGPLDEPIPGQG